jgi:hypothetical protein
MALMVYFLFALLQAMDAAHIAERAQDAIVFDR